MHPLHLAYCIRVSQCQIEGVTCSAWSSSAKFNARMVWTHCLPWLSMSTDDLCTVDMGVVNPRALQMGQQRLSGCCLDSTPQTETIGLDQRLYEKWQGLITFIPHWTSKTSSESFFTFGVNQLFVPDPEQWIGYYYLFLAEGILSTYQSTHVTLVSYIQQIVEPTKGSTSKKVIIIVKKETMDFFTQLHARHSCVGSFCENGFVSLLRTYASVYKTDCGRPSFQITTVSSHI